MRILFATQAEKTHMLSMVPLAWAFRAAGHQVLVASQPNMREAVTETGLPFCATGPNYVLEHLLRAFRTLDFRFPSEIRAGLADTGGDHAFGLHQLRDLYRGAVWYWLRMVNEPMLDDLVALCRAWRPDLVVWEPATHAGAIAAEACGAEHARFLWGVDMFTRLREEFLRSSAQAAEAPKEDPLADWLTACAARFGVGFREELLHGVLTIDPYPQQLGLPSSPEIRRLPVRYIAFNGRACLPAWLRRPPERARVCVTLGTTSLERFGRGNRLEDILAAWAELEVEVVVAMHSWQRSTPSPAPNVRNAGYVPLHALLAGCAAVVHHGGAGTCLTALSLGVPQLVLSDTVETKYQFDEGVLAERLAAQGAGIDLAGQSLTPGRAAESLGQLLGDSGFSRSAAVLSEQISAAPSPAALVSQLERISAGTAPAASSSAP